MSSHLVNSDDLVNMAVVVVRSLQSIYRDLQAWIVPNPVLERRWGDLVDSLPPSALVQKRKALAAMEAESLKSLKVLMDTSALPVEIRVRIWNATMAPRITTLVPSVLPRVPFYDNHYAGWCRIFSRTMPFLTDVNFECRAEVLKSYEMLSGSTLRNQLPFNMEIDTLYFPTSWCLSHIPKEAESTVRNVQHIAVGFDINFGVSYVPAGPLSLMQESCLARGAAVEPSNPHMSPRRPWSEAVVFQELLINVLSFPHLKSIRFVPHCITRPVHTIIVNKCQQELNAPRLKPFEPWGMLSEEDLVPESLIDLESYEVRWPAGWEQVEKTLLGNLMKDIKRSVDEHRGPHLAPLHTTVAMIPEPERTIVRFRRKLALTIPGTNISFTYGWETYEEGKDKWEPGIDFYNSWVRYV